MDGHEHLPLQNTITLGPSDAGDIWELSFRDKLSGEKIRIMLPREQLEEMDAEFTGLEHLL